MTQIMREAIKLDTEDSINEIELTAQLLNENKLLRDQIEAQNIAKTDLLWNDINEIKLKNDNQINARSSVESFISCLSLPNSDSSNSSVSK